MLKKVVCIIMAAATLSAASSAVFAETESAEFSKNSYNFTKQMTVGINIGNTLDAIGGETAWGCPKIEKGLIQSYKAKGFDTVRLPVTWYQSIDADGNFKDNRVFINRVKEVVDWIYGEGLYCILNTHHEMSWLRTYWEDSNGDEDTAKMNAMYARYSVLWTNIAETFKDYGERLIFEGYNETRADENNWSSIEDDLVALKKIGQTFVDAVRSTGGNNANRYLMLATYGASFGVSEINKYKMPTDPANHIILSVHSYLPHSFCFKEGTSSVFNETEFNSYWDSAIAALTEKYLKKGIGVIMGELGAVNKANTAERVKYAAKAASTCLKNGIVPIWWDNYHSGENANVDTFGIIDRLSPYDWTCQSVGESFVNTALEYSASRPNYGFKKGDVNLDDKVDLSDVRQLVGSIASGEELSSDIADIADYNSDGSVNLSDVRALVSDIASGNVQ